MTCFMPSRLLIAAGGYYGVIVHPVRFLFNEEHEREGSVGFDSGEWGERSTAVYR